MSEPSPTLILSFWAFMTGHFKSRVIDKKDAAEMKLVATFLDQLGILDKKAFLERYATTIGRRIYLPFTPGEPSNTWGPWEQMAVAVHEHQHVVQVDRLGLVTFGARYLTSSAQRAMFEAEAYRSNMEMQFWRFGTLPDPKKIAQVLGDYAIGAQDGEFVRKYLEASAASIKRGAVVNVSTKVALGWLAQHAPELRLVA